MAPETHLETEPHVKAIPTLAEAIQRATFADCENGMATNAFTVECETHRLKVIRKAGSLDHPPILLFKVEPIAAHDSIDYDGLSDDILEALDIYGDLEISFHGDETKTAVVDFNLV